MNPSLKKAMLILSVLLFLCAILIFRSQNISKTDPGVDQATVAAIVRGILRTQKNFPNPITYKSIMAARDTRTHVVAKLLFNQPLLIFTTGSMSILLLLSKVFGDSYNRITFFSELFSVFTVFISALVLLWSHKTLQKDWLRVVIGMFLIGTNFYLHYFSLLGIHNIAITFALACVLWASNFAHYQKEVSPEPSTQQIRILAIITFAAVHMYFSNLLLIPISVVLFLVSLPNRTYQERIKNAFQYCLCLGLLLIPSSLLFMVIKLKSSAPVFEYAYSTESQSGNYFFEALNRIKLYFDCLSASMGWFFLLSGLIGLFRLSVLEKNRMPLIYWFIHFLLWVLVPGFTFNGSSTWFRTMPYIIPVLYIGATYLLFELARISKNRFLARGIIIAGIAFHFLWNIPTTFHLQELKIQIPSFYKAYFESEGKIRRGVSSLSGHLNTGKPILFWTYRGLRYFQALTDLPFDSYLPALTSMEIRQKLGTLQDYAIKTGLKDSKEEEIFFVLDSEKPINQELNSFEVKKALVSVLGPNGLSWFDFDTVELESLSENLIFDNMQLKLFKVSKLSRKTDVHP